MQKGMKEPGRKGLTNHVASSLASAVMRSQSKRRREELIEDEMDDSARFDRMERGCENRWKDPDDVFFNPVIATSRSKSKSKINNMDLIA